MISILHPTSPLCYPQWSQEAQPCSNSSAFPHERDDETNSGPFDQMKLFSQAIFQCHISLCLIHEVGLSHWHHLSSSSRATGLSWPLSSRSRETDASEEHLSIKDSWRLRCISIFNQPQRNSWILYAGISQCSCCLYRYACMHVYHYFHAAHSHAHTNPYTYTTSLLCLSLTSQLPEDFRMPVTDAIPLPALLKLQIRAKTGKLASRRRMSCVCMRVC